MGLKIRLVEGAPITVAGKELRPLVRVTSWSRRQAVVREDEIGSYGAAAVWLRPVAVLERTAGGQRRISVPDETRRVMLALLLAALIVPLALNLLVRLLRNED